MRATKIKFQHILSVHTPFLICSVIAQLVKRWATGWTIGILGFNTRRGLGIFIFTTASTTALGPTQPIQWVPGALSLGVKRLDREADHSPPSSAKVKNAWSYTSTPPYVFLVWCLVKHRDNNFTSTLLGFHGFQSQQTHAIVSRRRII
jgi:hypothetical protein